MRLRGLTLVELLVAMTILSVIIMITFSVLFTVQKTSKSIEKKYDCYAEANRIANDMENSLRLARQLIAVTQSHVVFLNVHAETTEYFQKDDTLFRNKQIMTDLVVDSILFNCVKNINDITVSDFYEMDLDNNGVLDIYELGGVSGVNVHLWMLAILKPKSLRMRVERQFFIQLRNLRQ